LLPIAEGKRWSPERDALGVERPEPKCVTESADGSLRCVLEAAAATTCSELTEQLSWDARDAVPPAVVAFENTDRSAVEVTLVPANDLREPSAELISSRSNEKFAEPPTK
jgi:hypothetical protein